jgi:hypothetical protein
MYIHMYLCRESKIFDSRTTNELAFGFPKPVNSNYRLSFLIPKPDFISTFHYVGKLYLSVLHYIHTFSYETTTYYEQDISSDSYLHNYLLSHSH